MFKNILFLLMLSSLTVSEVTNRRQFVFEPELESSFVEEDNGDEYDVRNFLATRQWEPPPFWYKYRIRLESGNKIKTRNKSKCKCKNWKCAQRSGDDFENEIESEIVPIDGDTDYYDIKSNLARQWELPYTWHKYRLPLRYGGKMIKTKSKSQCQCKNWKCGSRSGNDFQNEINLRDIPSDGYHSEI